MLLTELFITVSVMQELMTHFSRQPSGHHQVKCSCQIYR